MFYWQVPLKNETLVNYLFIMVEASIPKKKEFAYVQMNNSEEYFSCKEEHILMRTELFIKKYMNMEIAKKIEV